MMARHQLICFGCSTAQLQRVGPALSSGFPHNARTLTVAYRAGKERYLIKPFQRT